MGIALSSGCEARLEKADNEGCEAAADPAGEEARYNRVDVQSRGGGCPS